MENLGALFFELSSDERMTILSNLKKQPLKLSHLAQRQDMTVTETSRHLQRLVDAELISRDGESLFKITPFGKLVFAVLPTLSFIVKNKKYFKDHDTSVIPPEFIERFGELSESTFNEDTISNLAHHEKIFSEAREICWSAADQFHWSSPPIIAETVRRGVDVRSILPEKIIPPVEFKPAQGVVRRTIPGFNVVVITTEKEAVLGLPYQSGRMDYAQFFSTDPSFIKWCKDLHCYFWERAKPMLGPLP